MMSPSRIRLPPSGNDLPSTGGEDDLPPVFREFALHECPELPGSAGILLSTGILVTPTNFAEVKAGISTCSSFDDFVKNFSSQELRSSQILGRGTMIVTTEVAEKEAATRADVTSDFAACNSVPPSALTSKMLAKASEASRMYTFTRTGGVAALS